MNRPTEQNSRWFTTDIARHARRVMDHNRTTTARIYVSEISGLELGMLRDQFGSVRLDDTGHLIITSRNGHNA